MSPRHTNNWAILVSTSRYWLNYRHIINTFSMYHVVKRLGIPDSNIILMIPDDMACNPRNTLPAQLFNNESHALDVYGRDVEVDYRGYEVTAANFLSVLTGRHPPGVPRSKRMLSDPSSNVLVYLSGHGGDEFMKFNDVEELLAQDLADGLAQAAEKRRYRELLLIVETCQAATLVQRVDAPNVITLACSQKGEQSLSYKSDPELGISLIDRFTYQTLAFFESIGIDSNATLQDLFNTYSYDLMLSHYSYRMTNASRGGPNVVKLTDFFGSVSETRTDSIRSNQDSLLHGDTNMARYLAGYLKQDADWDIDSSLLQVQPSARVHSTSLAGLVPIAQQRTWGSLTVQGSGVAVLLGMLCLVTGRALFRSAGGNARAPAPS
ncbi:hypothetical protein HYH03_010459 [Edaphochlamys debaryana]|uniref:GPI-anchor transamidase n=1 Tax=Edaphochlamys debaryana TaxID=47281 RepID=A0A835XU77_9CHLO|nr:hypothetical protein HYH03_010459 [Edaphochlamys debaryana]|eukprot:KAG2491252.1 hypothetical protein HYH03_010459 [Edaphochlamys debaryana]